MCPVPVTGWGVGRRGANNGEDGPIQLFRECSIWESVSIEGCMCMGALLTNTPVVLFGAEKSMHENNRTSRSCCSIGFKNLIREFEAGTACFTGKSPGRRGEQSRSKQRHSSLNDGDKSRDQSIALSTKNYVVRETVNTVCYL